MSAQGATDSDGRGQQILRRRRFYNYLMGLSGEVLELAHVETVEARPEISGSCVNPFGLG